MTNTIPSAGFIITGQDVIWGIGTTEAAAWADLAANMRMANVPHERDVDTDDTYCPPYWSEDQFAAIPATAALLAEVDARGGNIAWGQIGPVACTTSEEDGDDA
ncbi:MAG: hypothetical protein KGR68_09160 [Betaproteobacteria bacterium]|nr:hypothetical protein [Betaproteobacteria bacterium]